MVQESLDSLKSVSFSFLIGEIAEKSLDIRRTRAACSLSSIEINLLSQYVFSGIQQENRHIRQLQHENKELRAALEEHQNAIELIMSKYREHMACLLNSTKVDKNFMNQQKTVVSTILTEY